MRPAVPTDISQLVAFNRAMAEETEGKSLDVGVLTDGVSAVVESDAGTRGRYLVAELRGRVVGAVMHTWEWSDWRNGDIWWLQSVYVEPDFRRCGIFTAMYDVLRSEARSHPGVVGLRLYVERHNEVAQATYQRLGMQAGGYEVMEEIFGDAGQDETDPVDA